MFHSTDGYTGQADLTVVTNDQGHTGTGGPLTDTDTVHIGVVPQVWYIDNTNTGAGNGAGTAADPFHSIAAFNASAGPGQNDYIVIQTGTGTYTGDGLNLQDGQQVYGAGETLSFTNPVNGAVVNILDGTGTRPTINVTTAGDQGIDLAANNTIRGINITTAAGTTGLDDGQGASGNAVGNLTVSHMAISGAGQAVDIDQGGALNVTLDSVSSSGGAQGIQLGTTVGGTALTGSFVGGTGSISGSTSAGFLVGDGSGGASTGGTLAISYGGTISTGTAVSTVNIQDHSTGLVTLSGNLTHTGTSGSAIILDDNSSSFTFSGSASNLTTGSSNAINITHQTGGTVAFQGGLNIDTTSGTGVNLGTGNAGGTFNFTGGNLTIDTTGGNGFVATGGGTVNVTGSGNHINSGSGTALNISNTTIGASNVTFHDISANGGSNGIVLDTTGSSGGLHVTGNGTTVGASGGGVIQHMTGADGAVAGNGIYLNNTFDVELNGLQLNDFDNSAIRGFSVTGFTLTNSTISGTSGNSSGPTEGAITFGTSNPGGANGLLGTGSSASLIDNVNVSGAIEHTIEVYNQSGSFGLTISNSNIHDNSTASGSDGILMEMQGTATATVNITGNTFSNNKSQAIQVAANDSSSVNLTITNNTITRGTQGNEGIVLSNGSNGDLTTLIDGNTISGFSGVSIFVGQTAGNATAASLLQATISNNNITAPTTATNSAILAFLTSTVGQVSQARILIDNNTVTQNSTQGVARGIFVDTPDANTTPNFDVTVSNNTVHITDSVAGVNGIAVQARRGTMDADIFGNHVDFPNGTPGGVVGIRERQANTDGAATVPTATIQRDGSASGTASGVLADNNPGNTVEILGTVTIAANGTVQLPATPPLPLFAAPGGVASSTGSPGVTQLTQAQLDSVVAAAIGQWAHAGASAAQLAALAAITFSVADLAGDTIGEQTPGHIVIDIDAAGHGWFVDPTPSDNSEFAHAANAAGTDLFTDPSHAAAGHLDLLTTVAHEMGHVLGLSDQTAASDAHDLMYVDLVDGERRLPDPTDVPLVNTTPLTPSIAPGPVGSAPIVSGTPGNDTIDAGHGGNILFGGAGADNFVFANVDIHAATAPPLTHVADYHFAERDAFDFSALTSAFHGSAISDASVVRAVEDPSGTFATLQVNTSDGRLDKGISTWVDVVQLDGAHAGDDVSVLIDSHAAVHVAHLHAGLLM